MGRIEGKFRELKEQGDKALVLYLTAGDPDFDTCLELLACAASSGTDVIELGIPFSDPMADGPVIQSAFQRAIAGGFKVGDSLRLIREFRKYFSTPLVVFGYVNPILTYGAERFFEQAKRAGADGVLLVDVPFEEWTPFRERAVNSGLSWVGLVAPTSGRERIKAIVSGATGFVYVVSVTGITGTREKIPTEYVRITREVRKISDLPVVVGFGISNPETAKRVSVHCDGVVVGSAAVKIVEKWRGKPDRLVKEMSSFVENIKTGLTNGAV